jgi:hypothetical protein
VESGTLGGLRLQGCWRLVGAIGGLDAAEAGSVGRQERGVAQRPWNGQPALEQQKIRTAIAAALLLFFTAHYYCTQHRITFAVPIPTSRLVRPLCYLIARATKSGGCGC